MCSNVSYIPAKVVAINFPQQQTIKTINIMILLKSAKATT